MTVKKKIAIIGCSHSYYLECEQNWTTMFPDDFIVHNYSSAGHGTLHFEFILKYILHFELEYDMIIVQLTSSTRWQLPSTGSPTQLQLIEEQISDNYFNYYVDIPHIVGSEPINFESIVEDTHNVEAFYNSTYFDRGMIISRDDEEQIARIPCDSNPKKTWVTAYSEMFVNTLERCYSCITPNIYYWNFNFNPINNINHHVPGLDVVMAHNDLYGDLNDIIDDTLHLTPLGYRILFDEYIMKSKIGDYIKENS